MKAELLVIFDFDGTLADSWPVTSAELVAAAGPLRFKQLSLAELEQLRGHPTREVFRALEIATWRIPTIAAHLRKRFEQADIRLFDGVPRMLEALHAAGISIAVATSNSELTVRKTLGPDNMDRVARLACSVPVFGKSRQFQRLIRATHGIHAVSVGDETRDLDAAAKAGITGLAVEWGYAEPALLRSIAPGRTFATIADLTADLLRRAVQP